MGFLAFPTRLNPEGRLGASATRRCTIKRVTYLARQYKHSRYDRLRERGMLTKKEIAAQPNIHEQTLVGWAECGLVTSHAYNGHHDLYELPEANLPQNHCSRWNTPIDRGTAREEANAKAKILIRDQKDDAV